MPDKTSEQKPCCLMYALIDPQGEIDRAIGAWPTARETRECATSGRMGADQYERLGTESKRWAFLYRHGYRVKPVLVKTFAPVATGKRSITTA